MTIATGMHVVPPRQLDERLARLGLHVRRVDDDEAAELQPLRGDEVQRLERGRRDGLIVLVVGHEPAEVVGRQHFRRLEVPARERGLAAARRADEHDERELGDGHLHDATSAESQFGHVIVDRPASRRVNTHICVGAPTSASSGPTGTKRTS